ncbi:hypothetical protein YQ22_13720 [Maribacter sp. 1_2014MBL_MicDiv]|nr:hypothetical protein YQ22_13720 [Maribacter sp. 1_2014MBL_MicDiv]
MKLIYFKLLELKLFLVIKQEYISKCFRADKYFRHYKRTKGIPVLIFKRIYLKTCQNYIKKKPPRRLFSSNYDIEY